MDGHHFIGHLEIIQLILELANDKNPPNKIVSGTTPLHVAAEN
jgi:hypothetical protein